MNKQGSEQLQHTPTLLQICISRPQHISAKGTQDAPNSHPQDIELIPDTAAAPLGSPMPRQGRHSVTLPGFPAEPYAPLGTGPGYTTTNSTH